MKPLALLAALPLLLLACMTPAKHDVVVGMIARCQVYEAVTSSWLNAFGDECSANAARSVYVELTIRTPQGTTYTTSVPTNRPVQIGDPWPAP